MPLPAPGERDLRLDLFRGLALWLIFLDHIPSNILNWITIRNYGFSDATEIFVFISGYTAAFVYGRAMRERGVVVASARILKRTWQIYVAHVFLFAIYMAEISYVAATFENPLYGEEMGIFDFLRQPDITLVQALLLKFKPANMDVLPLYIVLLAGFPPMLWILLGAPAGGLGASLLLYLLTWNFGWNLPAYPNGYWVFNPFAWQLLFVFGAWCGLGGAKRLGALIESPITFARRRHHAREHIIDRPFECPAVHDEFDFVFEHVRCSLGHVLAILVAALAHHVPEQDAPLRRIDHESMAGANIANGDANVAPIEGCVSSDGIVLLPFRPISGRKSGRTVDGRS
jgi:hypothetical protein